MHFSTLTLKGQRSFRGHDTFISYILILGLLILFQQSFWLSKCIRIKNYSHLNVVIHVKIMTFDDLQIQPQRSSGAKIVHTQASFVGHYKYSSVHRNRRGSGAAVPDLTCNDSYGAVCLMLSDYTVSKATGQSSQSLSGTKLVEEVGRCYSQSSSRL